MKRFIIPLFAFTFAFALLSASAVTATKEYVDRQDGATLQAAKDYTDAHGGGGGGGVNTNAVEWIANRAVETNAVTVGLSSSVSGLQSSKLDGPAVAPTNTAEAAGKAADARLTGIALTNRYTRTESDAKAREIANAAAAGKLDAVWNEGSPGIVITNRFGVVQKILTKGSDISSIQIGDSRASGSGAISIGGDARAEGSYGVAIGTALARGGYSVSIGGGQSKGSESVAIGNNPIAVGSGSIVISEYGQASGERSIIIGNDSFSQTGTKDSIAIGNFIRIRNAKAMVFGNGEEDDEIEDNGTGSVSFYPIGGIGNFWIGSKNLQQYLAEATPSDYNEVKAAAMGAVQTWQMSHTNATFATEVLAVGLNIDTNAVIALNGILADTNVVAVIGEIAGWPVDPTTGATTIGSLLAALAAAVYFLKRKTSLLESDGKASDTFATDLLGKQVAKEAIAYKVATTAGENRSVLVVEIAETATAAVNVVVPAPVANKVIDFEVWVNVAARSTDIPQINYGYMVDETFTPVTLIKKGGENPAYEKDATLPVTNIVHFTSTDASGYTVVAAAFK